MSFSESPISSVPDARGPAACRAVLRALATALALVFAVPAAAGWQSTRWNMTPEEVAAAMAGQAPLSRGSGRDRLGGKRIGNVGSYRLGNARFRSVYITTIAVLPTSPSTGSRATAGRSMRASRASMARPSGPAIS